MASTSTSSIQRSYKYDVFISFRGEDTRKGFVGHLYDALQRQSIITYKDDEKIKKGNRISEELIGSIEDSRFYIIVFSKNYASSSWCLVELVKIMECQKTGDQRAYPVFFDVEPTEVRNQSGLVGKAFSKHEKDEAAGKWREALKEAAGLGGWELKNTLDGHEAKFIQKIVQKISLELRFIDSSVDEKLIGMEYRVKGVVSTLETDSDDVRMIGIKGIGGGGKTTLARAIFDHISSWFEGKSFVENVREVSKASLSGLKKLQKQILSDVLDDQEIKISSVHDGKQMLKKMMGGRKVLVVLDDVDHVEQLEALAGEPYWFKGGSRIIITTRDEQVLVAHRVNVIHNVNLLSDEEAICLFSRYAFGKAVPIKGYEELSGNVVRYAAGLPLTIRVLGSFLCGKTDLEWIDSLERLKTIPLKDTLEKLELSYVGLEADYKEIFLDVACILKGWEKEEAVEALESCGFHARNGLRVLEQRSLITITSGPHFMKMGKKNVYLGMHDHIEEMGKNIVRRSHPNEPEMHSRLWIEGEIKDVLTNDSDDYDAIQCIQWNLINNETCMRGLRKMKKLRFLGIHGGREPASQRFPNALRYLQWGCYPFECLKKSFQADNLVGLSMRFSPIMQFWKSGERQVLHKLRFLDMSYSNLKTFELDMTPNIEKLNLACCRHLVELKIPLGCSKLKALYLEYSRLRTLHLAPTPNLETLDLEGCDALAEITMPYQCPKPKFLRANSSELLISNILYCYDLVNRQMPNDCPMLKALDLQNTKSLSLNLVSNLENLDLHGCHSLVEIHIHSKSPKLKYLYLISLKLRTLDLGLTSDLRTLSLKDCHDLEELHNSNGCPNLKYLTLENSNLRKINLGLTPDHKMLKLEGCHDLSEFHFPNQFPKLESLSLNCPKLKTLDLRKSSDLKTLSLEECHELVELHMPNECPKLWYLNLKNSALRKFNVGSTQDLNNLMPNRCPNLKFLILENLNLRKIKLGLTPDLEKLRLKGCNDLSEFPLPYQYPKLESLGLICSNLSSLDLRMSSDIENLSLEECLNLVELHMPNECPKLKYLNLKNSAVRNLNLGSTPDLEMLRLEGCHDLVELYMPFQCPKLKILSLECSKLRTLYHVHTPDLETLSLEKCCQMLKLHMPNECPKIKSLNLHTSQLRSLNLGLTSNQKRLNIKECFHLVELRAPIECLEKLLYLDSSDYEGLKCFSLHKQIQSPDGLLHVIAESIDTCPMHSDSNLPEFRFSCWYEEPISSSIGNLGKFISIGPCPFTNLESFSSCIWDLHGLSKLTLEGSIREVPKDLEPLQSLEELSLLSTTIKQLPDSICMLKNLKLLELNCCLFIEKLPEGLGQLECLEDLLLTSCIRLQDIPKSICDMKRLRCLNLSSCLQVKKLPRELRRLECLKELNIKDTGISDLPDGIFELEGLHIVASDGFSCMVEHPQCKKQKT